MKNTLLALAVATLAASAHAKITLYKDDSSKVTLKAEIAPLFYMSDKDVKGGPDEKTDPEINLEAKIQFDFSHAVTDSLTAGGTFEIQNNAWIDGPDDNAEFDDVATYLKGDFGLLGFGEIGDVIDTVEVVEMTDILNELDNFYMPDEYAASDSKANAASYSYEFGSVTFVTDIYTYSDEDIDNQYGVGANYRTDQFSVGAMYQSHGDNKVTGDYDRELYAIAGELSSIDSLTLAATYSIYEQKGVDDKKAFTFAASFSATDATSLYGVFGMEDDGSADDATEIILGSQYEASSLLTLFTEVASRTDHAKTDTTEFLVGAYFNF